ncbi:unnamed protein product [Danaus chrysippus]|uniref:(African queen) hypothetical protein n=1 Tax=Danaus chrysippus TaxID=151541 RepID=A0A8J2VPH9_9NEOP|nr:unnamed protein product [Danaus chrysippus]
MSAAQNELHHEYYCLLLRKECADIAKKSCLHPAATRTHIRATSGSDKDDRISDNTSIHSCVQHTRNGTLHARHRVQYERGALMENRYHQ